MSVDPIRYAVLGLGRAGVGIHIKQLRERPDAKVVAVFDPLKDRRDKMAAELGCKAHGSLGRLLQDDAAEVVVVATPSLCHAADARKVLKAGKHAVVEKPMALTLSQADRVIQKAEETGRRLFVHHNYRFHQDFLHLREVLNSGVLGKLYHIRRYMSMFNRRNDWQALMKNGGGLLNNHGTHAIDQITQLVGGKITQVVGDMQHIAAAGDAEDHFKAFMRADNGVTVDLEMSTAQSVATPLPKWVFCGSCGTLTNDGDKSVIRWFDPAQAPALQLCDGPAQGENFANPETLPWQEKTVNVPQGGTNVAEFYDNVYAVLRQGAAMVVTPQSVREVMRVIAMIRKGTAFPGVAGTVKG